MNEDLHDIDKLFNNGIEGHRETVPPAVWEFVNNDLDKKQAAYYRSKYYRLKRLAFAMLLLCFAGCFYVMFTPFAKKSQTALVKTKASQPGMVVTSDSTNMAPVIVETKHNRNEEPVNKQEQKQINIPAEKANKYYDSTLKEFVLPSTKKQSALAFKDIVTKQYKTTTGNLLTNVKKANRFQHQQKQNILITSSAIDLEENTNNAFSATLNSVNKEDIQRTLPTAILITRGLIDLKPAPQKIKSELTNKASFAKNKIKSGHELSLSVYAAPNTNFTRLEDDDHHSQPGRNRHDVDRDEKKSKSFSAGILLNYGFTNKITLQSGISVTSSSTSIAPQTIYAKADNGHTRYELYCSSGYAYIDPKTGAQVAVGDSAKTSGALSKLTYIGIPVSISYHLTKGRFSFFPGVGAGINILASGKTQTVLSNQSGSENSTTKISGLKSNYFDGYIGLGIEYKLSKNIAISLRPNTRIALTPINGETPVKSYQNFLSVEAGLRIKL